MSGVREPAVAGRFYPANAEALRAAVQSYLQSSRTAEAAPKGIIAPHAGYVYSGPIAGKAHAELRSLRGRVERVGGDHTVIIFLCTPHAKAAPEKRGRFLCTIS